MLKLTPFHARKLSRFPAKDRRIYERLPRLDVGSLWTRKNFEAPRQSSFRKRYGDFGVLCPIADLAGSNENLVASEQFIHAYHLVTSVVKVIE
jgi:hypothetical protein